MKRSHRFRYQQFRRTHELLASGTPDPLVSVPLAELGDALARLDVLAVAQRAVERSARAHTVRIRTLAKALRVDHLRRIAIAAEVAYPGNGTELQALRTQVRQAPEKDYVRIILSARAVAKSIDGDVDRFVAVGLPKDFRTQMLEVAAALERALQDRAEQAQERRAATEGVSAQVRRGRLQLRLLDSLVRPSLQNDPERRAKWEQALRLARPGVVKEAEDGEVELPNQTAEEVKPAA